MHCDLNWSNCVSLRNAQRTPTLALIYGVYASETVSMGLWISYPRIMIYWDADDWIEKKLSENNTHAPWSYPHARALSHRDHPRACTHPRGERICTRAELITELLLILRDALLIQYKLISRKDSFCNRSVESRILTHRSVKTSFYRWDLNWDHHQY